MSGSFLKGALISFLPAGALGMPSLPNVIVFQINPETITHAWTEPAAQPPPSDPKVNFNPLAVPGVPGETFAFTLMLDGDQQIADAGTDPVGAGLATVSGTYSQLAALEMLQFPNLDVTSPLVGTVSAASSAASTGASASASATQSVPLGQVPIVLFVWGALRIVPVRVTAFSVTEKLYDAALNPTHAEATITLTVLTPDELKAVQGPMAGIANMAYQYMQTVRQTQATLNLAEAASSAIGMLPMPF
jgi:hypothetical protein